VTDTPVNEKAIRNKGIIAVVVFLAIILLPVCYAAYKEIRLRQQAKANTIEAPKLEVKK
jgi:hypothetical protein